MFEAPTIEEELKEVELKETNWTGEIEKYLDTDKLPVDKEEAKKIRRRTARFTKLDGVLYKRSYATPLLRCISLEEA